MGSRTTIASVAIAAAASVLLPARPVRAGADGCAYVVEKGDTVSRIARRHRMSVRRLVRANPQLHEDPNRLRVGQRLELCPAKRVEAPRQFTCGGTERPVSHQVRGGETLGGIAAAYAVSRASILRHNEHLQGRSDGLIRVGETLHICARSRHGTVATEIRDATAPGARDRSLETGETATMLAGVTAAVERYYARQTEAPPVQIIDADSHDREAVEPDILRRDARGVDVGYVFEPSEASSGRKLDLARTWSLLHSFLEEKSVDAVFVDYAIQRRLYGYALSIGIPRATLERLFQYPESNSNRETVVHHRRGHTRHFHVRFADERARHESGRPTRPSAAPPAI